MSLSRQQYTLIGIFALFMAPLILVMLMRSSWWQYQPAGMKNQGYLVQPPVRLSLESADSFDRKWLILYRLGQECDKTCIDHVTSLRQIHRAMGQNTKHLAIVLISDNGFKPELQSKLESIYPEFQIIPGSSKVEFDALDRVNANRAAEMGDSNSVHTYVLDPMLNVILAYGTNQRPGDIHKDIKRLLKWSEQENNK